MTNEQFLEVAMEQAVNRAYAHGEMGGFLIFIALIFGLIAFLVARSNHEGLSLYIIGTVSFTLSIFCLLAGINAIAERKQAKETPELFFLEKTNHRHTGYKSIPMPNSGY